MKLSLLSLVLLALWTLSSSAADVPAGAASATLISTNQPAKTGTNLPAGPKPPGVQYTNSAGMLLLKVPGGFWAGEFEVTQKEYQKVMDANPSAFGGETQPVENISYNDALEFCKKMTALDLKKKLLPEGFYYTLPTEDEWASLMADATAENAVTSLNGNLRAQSEPVGSTQPNSLGLYDVRGNVMEFCLSDESKAYRVLKGGSWQDRVEVNLRPEFRWYCMPDETQNTFGFRCLLKSN